jgi:hypothetical protein
MSVPAGTVVSISGPDETLVAFSKAGPSCFDLYQCLNASTRAETPFFAEPRVQGRGFLHYTRAPVGVLTLPAFNTSFFVGYKGGKIYWLLTLVDVRRR